MCSRKKESALAASGKLDCTESMCDLAAQQPCEGLPLHAASTCQPRPPSSASPSQLLLRRNCQGAIDTGLPVAAKVMGSGLCLWLCAMGSGARVGAAARGEEAADVGWWPHARMAK